ncbi:hypothetical protein AtNW77_Chr5g0137421 [Arabidopsis thaliana]|nr:hypothetical protein ISN45_At05g047960 [Arabidopsis thaliana x Arabidopsis arenosa]
MGLFLVLFPDHNNNDSSSSYSPAKTTFRSKLSSRLLLSKAESTISSCIILLFLTLFLFTLSTFEEPSSRFPAISSPHRRFLLNRNIISRRFALQGMGTLFLRGTKSMHDLIIAHIASVTTENDLRLFIRLLHRSGVTSKSDVVLLFNSPSSTTIFTELIEQENNSFLKLVHVHRNDSMTSSSSSSEPVIWGKKSRHRANYNSNELTHGSIVGFDVTELDPENSLSGFMDQVPLSLRRWACYPMLLGRVRRSFKHVMLVDAKTSFFIGDPFTRIRNRSPDSVLFFFSKHKNASEVNPEILIGGAKGIRRLSSSMHTEIVRATMMKKNSVTEVTESVVLSQLVGNVHMTKNFQVVLSESVVPEAN